LHVKLLIVVLNYIGCRRGWRRPDETPNVRGIQEALSTTNQARQGKTLLCGFSATSEKNSDTINKNEILNC
jgi:hypothetical protein